jgi:cytochrome c-type biogenesis protein CcmH/NrfF
VNGRSATSHRPRVARWARAALVGGALLLAGPEAALGPEGSTATAQQLGQGMVRTGTVGIANDDERRLFYSLLCTCGCPRETLGTCTCDFAHARREELRALLEEGKSLAEIQELYAKRFGTQALAVPPNVGGSRALWALPLFGIVAAAGGVAFALARWRRRGGGPPDGPGAGGGTAGRAAPGSSAHDAYDDKLDRELEELDRS